MTLLFHKSMSVPLSLFGSFELTSMGQTPACMGVDTGDTQTGLQPTLTEGQSACLNFLRSETLCSCKCSLFLKNPETLEYLLFFYFNLFSLVCVPPVRFHCFFLVIGISCSTANLSCPSSEHLHRLPEGRESMMKRRETGEGG